MRRLKEIMKIENYDLRIKELSVLARDLGVPLLRVVGAEKIDGRTDEEVIVYRIQQAIILRQGRKMWLVALISAIASVLSALASWFAVIK